MAVRALEEVSDGVQELFGRPVSLRMGIHTGRVVGCIIGRGTPRFRCIGDTCNTASRMSSTCPPGRIQITDVAARALMAATGSAPKGLHLEERGIISVK